MTASEYLAQVEARAERATKGPIKYGIRRDTSVWLSIGDPVTGPHIQADWEFGENNAQAFTTVKDVPRLCRMLRVAMEFIDHEDGLWGDPNNPAAQTRAKIDAIANGEDAA
jgi:hypothetical protein